MLLLVARTRFFDNWDWPIALIAVFLFDGALVVFETLSLRWTAKRARRRTLERMQLQRDTATRWGECEWGRALSEVKRHTGAFSPLMESPAIPALLLPISGVGGAALVEFLGKAF
jgi:hypothetical protein